jgi:DNA gyrase/topoisomerase IV subunit B
MSQTEKVFFSYLVSLFMCSVIIMTLQIKGTPNTSTFYYSDKTKAQPLGSRLKQWNLLEKGVIVSFYTTRQSDIATYYSRDGDLVY